MITIKTLEELDIVSNQHLSIEMFLLRLVHLKYFKPKSEFNFDDVKIEKIMIKIIHQKVIKKLLIKLKMWCKKKN